MDESGDNKIYHISSSLFGNHKKPSIALPTSIGPVRLQKIKIGKNCHSNDSDCEKKSPSGGTTFWSVTKEKTLEPPRSLHNSHAHSKKGIKHALRQQAKRRRKNTTIAAGNSAPIPRFVPPTSVECLEDEDNRLKPPTTMNDILTSIPGFCIKHRKRTNKKLSTAAQLEQTKEGCIDLETPDSILVQTNLRDLLNEHTFVSLPPLYQYKLVQLLPPVDRISVGSPSDYVYKLSPSGLNNEFFKSACSEWKDRLAEGEFTPENQQKSKLEAERERNKLDPWKVKHFEPIWGENSNPPNSALALADKDSAVSPRSFGSKGSTKRPPSPVSRSRTVGAVTRSVAMYREKREAEDSGCDTNKKFKPASNPSTNYLTQFNMEGKGNHTYEKKRLDKPLEIKIVESRHEHRDRQEIPLIKAVQFEPDLSMCSILGTKVTASEDEGARDTTDHGVSRENPSSVQVDSNTVENVAKVISVATSSNTSSATTFVSPTFSSVTILPTSDPVEPSADIETKEYETPPDTVEEVIVTAKKDHADEAGEPVTSGDYVEFSAVEVPMNEEDAQKAPPVAADEERAFEKVDKVEESAPLEVTPEVDAMTETEPEPATAESSPGTEENLPTTSTQIVDEDEPDDTLLEESVNIRKMISEEAENWTDSKEDQVAILEAAWNAVDSSSEKLLAEVNLTDDVFGEEEEEGSVGNEMDEETDDALKVTELTLEARCNEVENVEEYTEKERVTEYVADIDETSDEVAPSQSSEQVENVTEKSQHETDSPVVENPEEERTILQAPISIDRIIGDDDENWDNTKEEQVQAAILAAAWNAVDSSTEKLLAQAVLERETEVSVIPMQEELEVKLEESSSPAPEWAAGFGGKTDDSTSTDPEHKAAKMAYTGGHVKLELEVTLTPEVDSQVTSTGDGSGSTSKPMTTTSAVITPSTVIPPTTIVCLPTTNTSIPPPPTTQIVTNQSVSSSALPYIALTTSTPVRAVPTKTPAKTGGRGGRNTSNKPPPGAVNLERSYQICQAVIQSSPNRDQLKFQLKPPPSLMLGNKEYPKPQTSSGRGGSAKPTKTYNAQPQQNPMFVKHVFTSAQGIPVTMAVLPTSNTELTESQMGQYVLVQRSGLGGGIRRSNSAPPSNPKCGTYGIGGRGRPASVGMQQHQQQQQQQQQQISTQPVMRTIVSSPNGPAYYPVPQQYNLVTRVKDCSGCTRKAMVMCKKCGAFCHDDCIEPYKICVNCR